MKCFRLVAIPLLAMLSNVHAQKKPVDHSVYDDWKSINRSEISRSGNLIYYTIVPQEGDALTVLKDNKSNTLLEIPRSGEVKLSKDEKFFISSIKAAFQETRQAKIKKKKADEMPKDSLLVFNINKKSSIKFPLLKSYQLARNSKNYLAFVADVDEKTLASKVDTSAKKETPKKAKTSAVLHVLDLNTGDTTQIWKADNYQWSENEEYLVYTKKGAEKDSLNEAGLYIYDLGSKQSKKISHGKGTYKSFSFDDQVKQFIFLADKTPEKSLLKEYNLYYYTPSQDTAVILANRNTSGIPKNWFVSGDGNLSFSQSGERIFFGLAPIPRVKDTTLVDFETAKVDIWHWQDEYIQPMQLANVKRDQARNFTAMIHMNNRQTVKPLSDDTYNRISMTGDADKEWAIATSDQAYRIATQWEGSSKSDIYIISTLTGETKLVAKAVSGFNYLSPEGDHVIYFDRGKGNWYSYAIQSAKTTLLNEGIPVSFVDEENDVPAAASAYGLAGWSKDGQSIFLNDRYDIWKISLDGKQKQNITLGKGREDKITYRYQSVDRSDNPRLRVTYIDERKPIYLSGFNHSNKYNGYYQLGKKDIQTLWSGPYTYKSLQADEALKQVIYTKENYQAYPDLYVLKNFKEEIRLTDINPQQANYNWGTAELVKWTTPKGYAAEGILYKPEDFDPNKKYPIIAYFYEILSNGLHTYQAPAPTASRLNISYFVSNGYLVFAPDIRYEEGYPGKSAEEFINSGMNYLAKTYSYVDATKMGIQGQSWGGYQVAHLITRTNMYAAAWSGAPVVNMTSAYGGIRWGTGMSRQFQYENTQSRIGKPLWEALDLYIENSPLFFMDKVNTPVAIMHNDQDGAVPWYQGIEFYTALRRLNKPVWLLNYNGDDHNLIQRQNRKDIQIREVQFFDHFLKGAPAPTWISKGVKATEKGIDWGLDIK